MCFLCLLWPNLSMKHYDFADKFHALYDKAVKTFAAGQSDQAKYFTAD